MAQVNPYTANGIAELNQQAQIAARHARHAATSAALAGVLAKGELVNDLRELAATLAGHNADPMLRDWPKKLKNYAERINVAMGKVTEIGQS